MTETTDIRDPFSGLQAVKTNIDELSKKDKAKAQHEKNKLTARERIELLVDVDSFVELNSFKMPHGEEFNK